ncbi:MAG TPA: ATP-binding protein [Planctomycetota bacterium]|jgi:MinD superfamily P-loop ATPase|nr:ATP-binding protein [Planctomycetota bacterium]OQC20907.1 MAG: ferredoxin [Planctomycetes bacterium ADurb.Bin069]NMD34709.1 P-loop NTPase [Planctomycetota bacterium]HNR98403.1 ATP-binding protein [Planctomycetota bacterium]HNU25177.1 ATP-binding protein [Planctomycetota bacterium]
MIIAIASGKGGTGKTTLAVNLARAFDADIQLLDCDVEEPNAHLFLPAEPRERTVVTMPIPEVDARLCDGCGECARVCRYNAIVGAGAAPLVFPELCHGCGGCAYICPRKAIREVPKRIGVIETFRSGKIDLVHGRLDVGVAMAPPLIRAVKDRRRNGAPAIIDAPPGTSCPVVAAIQGAEAVVLVTEPTPFGLHDLALAVDLVRAFRLPFGVVVNRAGSGDDRVRLFCAREKIPLLAEIPDDRRIAEAYARGALIVEALPEYRAGFLDLRAKIEGLRREVAA